VTARREGPQVAARPAAEIEDGERRLALDRCQQRLDVLADVVLTRARPEVLGAPFVVGQGAEADQFELA
jgi:hypothetical protein